MAKQQPAAEKSAEVKFGLIHDAWLMAATDAPVRLDSDSL